MRPRHLLLVLASALCVLLATTAAPARADGPPGTQAKSAIVMEASTGDILFTKRAYSRRSIASTTKLMTALVTLQQADLDDVYTAVPYKFLAAESRVGLVAGERMSVRDLLRALLLPSANDAAATLAVGSMGSRKAFVQEMNRQAKALGLRDTSYANPVGLDEEGNYSSARDLATLTIALRKYEFIRDTVDRAQIRLKTGGRPRTVVNRNNLVRQGLANGMKTGNTNGAGHVLVGSASKNGVTVITAVLGEPSEAARDADSAALLKYGLRNYRRSTLLPEGRKVGTIDLEYRDTTVDVLAGRTIQRVLRSGRRARVTVAGLPDEVDGPLPRGSRVGTITVRVGDKVIARVPAVTARPVAEAGLGDRLDDMAQKPITIVALCLLLACSLPLLVLRRRALDKRRALEAERRRARRREETPVA